MIFYVISLLAFSNYAASRDVSKMMRQGPSISNSLVNLGKMDISFYIGKPADAPSGKSDYVDVMPNGQIPKPQLSLEPCPCSEFRSKMDNMFPKPSEIITRILKNKDLFKNPSSSVCCDSHEQIHEDTFVFELTPNDINKGLTKFSALPIPRKMKPQIRSKAVEIFLFPKRKDLANVDFMKQSLLPKELPQKEDIKKVGKEVSFIKSFNEGSTVKKDLAVMETNAETKKVENKPTAQNVV